MPLIFDSISAIIACCFLDSNSGDESRRRGMLSKNLTSKDESFLTCFCARSNKSFIVCPAGFVVIWG